MCKLYRSLRFLQPLIRDSKHFFQLVMRKRKPGDSPFVLLRRTVVYFYLDLGVYTEVVARATDPPKKVFVRGFGDCDRGTIGENHAS